MKNLFRDIEPNIFSFFNHKDLYNTSMVSRHWNELTLMSLLNKTNSTFKLDELRKLDGENLVIAALNNKQLGLVIVAYQEFNIKISVDGLLKIMENDFETAKLVVNNNNLFNKFNKEQLISLIKIHDDLCEFIIEKCVENNFDSQDIQEIYASKIKIDYSAYFEGAINSSNGGLVL